MRIWGTAILFGLMALSVGASAKRDMSGEGIWIEEGLEPAAESKPQVDAATLARKRAERERLAAERERTRAARERAARVALSAFTSPRLTRFAGDREFARYIEAVEAARRARYADRGGVKFAQVETDTPTASDAAEPPRGP